ncbi:NAD(P)/FAD-dependent oxidoreductase [Shimia ponticola]|uniref:NAD(P)/FAD-dependent oxidoreductase n=1 Tax=Shimia ponticola TaxID=2582893 RepID=UPI0011BD645A|nr:FAD-binding oxidoreductase [Shimia ponticola]
MNPLYRNDRPGTYPASWYVDTSDIPAERPALRGERKADVAIVGAGFTGLTAALVLAEKGFDVIVLDAHRVGFGASGRNGGQCGSGFNMDLDELEATLGEDTTRHLWNLSMEAKAQVRDLVAKHAPEARWTPGVADGVWTKKEAAENKAYYEKLCATYEYDALTWLDGDDFREIVKSPVYKGGALDMDAGHIHPLRYCLGLARAAEAAGVTIHERSDVHHIADGLVQTGQGRVVAKHIILAGNGYLPNLNRRYAARVSPINSFIGATEPLGEKAHDILARDIAVADSKFVVNYFRLSEDNRLLFGGRENYGIGFPKDIQTRLHSRMTHLFPQLRGVPFTHVWGGTLGITMTRVPYVARLGPTTLAAGGFSGHGVALTSIAGRCMAEAIAGQAERFDLLSQLPTPPFPGGSLFRAPILTLAMTWYATRDKLGL